jgi:hypothetical protein
VLYLGILAASLLSTSLSTAQTPPRGPGAELTVYLVTMGHGDAIWEKFGHNAIWFRDTTTGLDVAYNWGIFDFDDADFIPRFLEGDMRYHMAGFDGTPMIAFYAEANRSVWAQELELTPAQKRELLEFARWNARPENRYYRYDYFRDNCSTRVRDAIDRALGGLLRASLDSVPTGTTYRWHNRRLTLDAPLQYTGMDIVLGQPGDQRITAWEESFLPMRLREHVRTLRVAGAGGVSLSLVRSERQLFEASRPPEPEAPRSRLPIFLAIGGAVGALLAVLGVRASRGGRGARIGFITIGTTWCVVAGIVGTVMALSWLATDHVFMYRNENLLQLSPLSLLAGLLLPWAIARGFRRPAAAVAVRVVAGLSIAGFVLQALPGLDQVNGETIALALPVHLGLAFGVWALTTADQRPSRNPRTSSTPSESASTM